MSILARLIFCYYDFACREQEVSLFVNEIKEARRNSGKYGGESGKIILKENSRESGLFLDRDHWLLDKEMLSAEKSLIKKKLEEYIRSLSEKKLKEEDIRSLPEKKLKEDELGYLNRTLFKYTGKDLHEPHPFVVSAMIEACVIAEGVLQLAENIVKHAGSANRTYDKKHKGIHHKGIGLLSIHLRNLEVDKDLLQKRYKEYMKGRDEKFFFEIVISDLSDSNIPQMFRNIHNNDDHTSDIDPTIFDGLTLGSFFSPEEYDCETFWEKFYKKPENAVKHFGLEIFLSVVKSKDGFFSCMSGKDSYTYPRNIDIAFDNREVGTTYNILLPISAKYITGGTVRESNLEYSLTQYVGKVFKPIDPLNGFLWETYHNDSEEQIKALKRTFDKCSIGRDQLMVCRVDEYIKKTKCFNIERLVKAALWHLYDKHDSEPVGPHRLAIVGFSDFEFFEIVRIIALYYNKHGENNNMEQNELYLHGKNIGSEIVIFGKDLAMIRNRITKSVALSGVAPKYIEAIQSLLTRKRELNNDR
jgi:hypothetical protein